MDKGCIINNQHKLSVFTFVFLYHFQQKVQFTYSHAFFAGLEIIMKDINLLVWLMQLGISAAVPLAGFILLSVWLHNSRGWGSWVVIAGIILGILSAVSGLRSSLAYLNKASKPEDEDEQNVISYNEHD